MSVDYSDPGSDEKNREVTRVSAGAWHDRAWQAAGEKRRALLSLSSGGVATFFVALTADSKVPLPLHLKVVVSCGASLFGLAVVCGVMLWHAEVKRAYSFARLREAMTGRDKKVRHRIYRRWTRIKNILALIQQTTFALGIAAATIFTISKAWSY